MIESANTIPYIRDVQRARGLTRYQSWILQTARKRFGPQLQIDFSIVQGTPLPARINHNRWIVDCPSVACSNAMWGEPNDPVFFCTVCLNNDNGRLPYPVAFPEPSERELIEAVLTRRLFDDNRSWEPGETAQDLIDENNDHDGSVV